MTSEVMYAVRLWISSAKGECSELPPNLDAHGLTDSCFHIHRYTLVDILRAILLSLEAMIEDPELQVNGFVLIIDWSNFTFKQASKLTPSMLRLAIEGLQVIFFFLSFPNSPWYFLFFIFLAVHCKSGRLRKHQNKHLRIMHASK